MGKAWRDSPAWVKGNSLARHLPGDQATLALSSGWTSCRVNGPWVPTLPLATVRMLREVGRKCDSDMA